jgi:pilus assembly protein CpaB
MTARARRRRAALLLALALAAGGIAASRVHGRATAIEQQVGPLVPVLVAVTDVPAGKRIGARMLAVRQVPQQFVPPDALSQPREALGQRLGAPVAAGGYVTAAAFAAAAPAGEDGDGSSQALARGQRAIELAVAGGEALTSAPPGARVDVLVTTDSRSGSGRTFLALQDVELLAVREADAASEARDGAAANATAVATLRVTLRQAVYLTAAQSFARELRLLVRSPGDRRSAPPTAVDGGRL